MKTQKGSILIILSFIISIISVGLMFYLQSAHQTQLALKSKIIALNDASLAIEQIGRELKHAYEMSAPVPASKDRKKRLATITKTPVGAENNKSISFYLPAKNSRSTSSGVSQSANQICINRSDLSDFSSSGQLLSGSKTICITLPDDLEVRSTYPTLDLELPLIQKSYKFAWLIQVIQSSKIFAQSHHPSSPSLPATPTTKVTQSNTQLNASLKKQYYDNLDCTVLNQTSNTMMCITVRICILASGSCTPDQYIKQTYVYYKNPTMIF